LEYSVWIDGTDSDCNYTDIVVFNVGVDASISYDNTICVGEDFSASSQVDVWSSGHVYEWTTTSDLIIESPDSSATTISSETVLGAGVFDSYDISLTITNEVGCWETEQGEIEVYEVVADFTVSDSILHCSPQQVNLTSLNNDYVDSWDWSLYLNNSDFTEYQLQTDPSDGSTSSIIYFIGYYDVAFNISSEHGCSDSLYSDSIFVMNDLDPIIEELNPEICFNGNSVLEKQFEVNFNSVFDIPMDVVQYSWMITPEVNVSDEDVSNLTLLFTESDVYTISYIVELENGFGTTCIYSAETTLTIGVSADLTVPEIVCVGEPFEAQVEVAVGIGSNSQYQWSSESNLNFSDPNSLITHITAQDTLSGNQVDTYEVEFIVTNDFGCWEEQIGFVEVYELVADFSASDTGEICAPVVLNFNSLYNNYVNSYEWSYTGENYLGESLSYIYPPDTLIYGDFFNEMAVYDISLALQSIHGCSDTITKSSLLDIKRPYPFFSLETNYGCDGVEISIIDSSYYSSNIGLFTQNVFYDSTFYNLNDTTFITYLFPYSQTTELNYSYPITLNAFLGQCSSSYTDTIIVFPKPVIEIVLSDSMGCPPFEVDFTDNSTYVIEDSSTYYWDFGDGSEAFTKNTEHTYDLPGEYVIYHSVTSADSCFRDTILSTTINVFDYPEALFNYETSTFCHGESDIHFENTSIFETDSINSLWTTSFDTSFVSNVESPFIYFADTGSYYVNLQITDLHGCVDDTTRLIEVAILDTLVSAPILDYVTIDEHNVKIVWPENQDEYFDNLSVYHSTDLLYWNLIHYTGDLINTEFIHDLVSTNQVNYYSIIQQDTCGYYSNISTIHSPVLLTLSSPNYQVVDLSWTDYIGWEEVDYYDVFKSIEGQGFELIGTVSGNLQSFSDSSLCNVIYTYYVEANNSLNQFISRSNTQSIEPLFIDFSIPINVSYSTVIDNQFILTEWTEIYESDMTFYTIDRWDDYFGWIEEFDILSESPFLDVEVGVSSREYLYRVAYGDVCGNYGPESNLGSNILLEGTQYTSHYYMSWSAYQAWSDDIAEYVIQYFDSDSMRYINLEVLSNTTFSYTDNDLSKDGIDTSYCYRVLAINAADDQIVSISNERCFVAEPKIYFPNAFTPNNDGLNETFKYEGVYAKSINIEIFDRWGNAVFVSNEVNFEWNGLINNSGNTCPQGTYVVRYDLSGFNGTMIKDELILFLIR